MGKARSDFKHSLSVLSLWRGAGKPPEINGSPVPVIKFTLWMFSSELI